MVICFYTEPAHSEHSSSSASANTMDIEYVNIPGVSELNNRDKKLLKGDKTSDKSSKE